MSDMRKCEPQSALSSERRKRHWQTIEYETDEVAGTMLSAGPGTGAPDVTYPLDLRGWYSAYVGIWGLGLAPGEANMIKIRLDDDPCFTVFTREKPSLLTLEEGFWKHADLTDQDIIIGQQNSGFPTSASLAYVRLVPLSSEEVERIRWDRENPDARRLIGANDAFSDFWRKRSTTKEDILEMVEPYRNTDFKKLFWEVGNGHATLVGDSSSKAFGEGIEDFPRIGDRFTAESFSILASKGIDPLKIAIEHSHGMGLELHISERVEMFFSAPPWEEFFSTSFYSEHPELRLVDRDGTQIAGMSYAYPEVRAHYISVLKKAASYGADGAVIIYVRGPPIILYETPVVEGFKARHGVDPRELDEKDEAWLKHRASYVTVFMREVRQAMDEVGEKPGKRLEVSAITLGRREHNLFYGFDIEAWVEQGLIDNLILYPSNDGHANEGIDMRHYAHVTRGTRCKLYPNMMPRRMLAGEFRKKALGYYESGADGLFFWDTNDRHDTTSMWTTIRRLGHRSEIKDFVTREKPEEEPRTTKLLRLGGYFMQKYSPYRGG